MQNLKSLRLFFVLALPSQKISVRTMLKVDLFDIGPENLLFAGLCVDLSVQNYTGWGGSEGVKLIKYK